MNIFITLKRSYLNFLLTCTVLWPMNLILCECRLRTVARAVWFCLQTAAACKWSDGNKIATESCVRSMAPILSPELTQASSPSTQIIPGHTQLASSFQNSHWPSTTADKTAVPTSEGTVPLLFADTGRREVGKLSGSIQCTPHAAVPRGRLVARLPLVAVGWGAPSTAGDG